MTANVLHDDLKALIQAGHAVAVVGAGMSIAASGNAPAASWRGLLKAGASRCEAVVSGLPTGWGERVRSGHRFGGRR